MDKSHFIKMAAFNVWANKMVETFISDNIDDGLAEKKIISSFPSVKTTIYHIWDAESIWLERMSGRSPMEFASINFKGSFKEGLTKFLDNSQMIHSFLIAKDESYFSGNVSYTHTSGK